MTERDLTRAIQAYLEAIFELDEASERVTQARLSRWFGVSRPATSEIVHRMHRAGLLDIQNRKLVLTARGREAAGAMVGRHRLIERFLVDVLGVPWHMVDDEARRLEPGVSAAVEERMRTLVGGADTCPHGNPFPVGRQSKRTRLVPLSECAAEGPMRIDRIREDLEMNREMLEYLEKHNLLPGAEIVFLQKIPEGGVLIRQADTVVPVGPILAAHILCVAA